MSDSSTVTIEELKSTGAGRRIVLVGPGLPFQGADWPGEQRLVTTFYPGNKEASQQVLGPRELPSSWEGFWRRTMMSRAPSLYRDENGQEVKVTSPFFLREALEDILRAGRLLRVTWAQTRGSDQRQFEITRTGRAEQWNFPVDRAEDIGWKVTFAWTGRGNPSQKVVATREGDLESTMVELDATMNEFAALVYLGSLQSKKLGIFGSKSKLTLGQLEALAKAPNDVLKSATQSLQRNINKIRDTVKVADKFRSAPFEIKNTVTSFTKNNVAIINQYYDTWSRRPVEAQSAKSNASDLTRALTYFGQSAESMKDIARQSQETQGKFDSAMGGTTGSRGEINAVTNSAVSKPVIAVHVCKDGDTPFTVSLKYYGSTDNALAILSANRLNPQTLAFKPGKILIINSPTAAGELGAALTQ